MLKSQPNKVEVVPEGHPKVHINELLHSLDDVANKIGESIEKLCQKQEEAFINDYKEQMYNAQKNLSVFAQNNTEEEIKRKMKEKQKELKDKRESTLSETIKISNDLKELKFKLHEVTMNAENVDDEIKFIDEQMIVAEDKNRRLKDEVEGLKMEVLRIDPNFKFWDEEATLNMILPLQQDNRGNVSHINEKFHNNSSFLSKVNNSELPDRSIPTLDLPKKKPLQVQTMQGMKSHPKLDSSNPGQPNSGLVVSPEEVRDIAKLKKELDHQKQIYEKLKDLYDNEALYPGRYETVFVDCIRKVTDKNKDSSATRQSLQKLPALASVRGQIQESNHENSNSNRPVANLTDLAISEMDKKGIMEEFLENGLVKELLYQKFVEAAKISKAKADKQ